MPRLMSLQLVWRRLMVTSLHLISSSSKIQMIFGMKDYNREISLSLPESAFQ